jgi:cell division protein FtsI (penicillin-binding protein 3)
MDVSADPRRIRDAVSVATAAGRELEMDLGHLIGPLSDRRRRFVYVARQIDPSRAAKLARRGIVGLDLQPSERRTYPQRSVAAQLLGQVDVDNRGIAGLELALNGVLSGRPGSQRLIHDPAGRSIAVRSVEPARDGRDVQLTVDAKIQARAEAVLRDTVRTWEAKGATAVVLDPRSGELLAMAVAPTFDANRFGRVPAARTRNPTVTDTYEPGSTFKIVTFAAALTEKVASPSSQFLLRDSIQVADRTIHESHPRNPERLTFADIVSRSSNVGTLTLALKLGERRVANWISRFGFGRKTGVDFPGETRGLVLPLNRWSGSTIGNVPIGQGIAVTPLQMASAYGTIANRGVLVQPHLVRRVADAAPTRPVRRRVLDPAVAQTLMGMLEGVVDDRLGTGTAAAIKGYRVAGKTGTAAKPERHGYSRSRYVASFVGVVPATNPRLVVLVTVDEPKRAIWGGVVAAPAFQAIARFALTHLEVPSDAPVAPE